MQTLLIGIGIGTVGYPISKALIGLCVNKVKTGKWRSIKK